MSVSHHHILTVSEGDGIGVHTTGHNGRTFGPRGSVRRSTAAGIVFEDAEDPTHEWRLVRHGEAFRLYRRSRSQLWEPIARVDPEDVETTRIGP